MELHCTLSGSVFLLESFLCCFLRDSWISSFSVYPLFSLSSFCSCPAHVSSSGGCCLGSFWLPLCSVCSSSVPCAVYQPQKFTTVNLVNNPTATSTIYFVHKVFLYLWAPWVLPFWVSTPHETTTYCDQCH